MPSPRTVRSLATAAVAVLALSALTACSASHTGFLAIGMDPAGRIVATVAVCDDQRLKSLTLTDETTGSSVTVKPTETPAFGATVILTSPVVNPRPEGVFDLLDLTHTYTLGGVTKEHDSDDDSGTFPTLRFKLEDLVKEPRVRQDAVATARETDDSGALVVVLKTDFVRTAREACS